MFERFRLWLAASLIGKSVAVGTVVLCLLGACFSVWGFVRGSAPPLPDTMYICSETGKTFRHRNQMGETVPIYSSYSGKDTGFPAEACYWNADGSAKSSPTWVFVKAFIGDKEPTFCPDCGRLVVGHNPQPGPGVNPPPTAEVYAAQHRPPSRLSRKDGH